VSYFTPQRDRGKLCPNDRGKSPPQGLPPSLQVLSWQSNITFSSLTLAFPLSSLLLSVLGSSRTSAPYHCKDKRKCKTNRLKRINTLVLFTTADSFSFDSWADSRRQHRSGVQQSP